MLVIDRIGELPGNGPNARRQIRSAAPLARPLPRARFARMVRGGRCGGGAMTVEM
jgi:hypothetical protein